MMAPLVAPARGLTFIAIVAGTTVGVLAALFSARRGAPPPRAAEPASASVQSSAPALRISSARPESRPPSRADPVAPIGPGRGELDSRTAEQLELACSRREASACLAAARAYDLGRGVRGDAGTSRLYRALAVSLLDEQCRARDPKACQLLAGLYATGSGVSRSDATAALLRGRSEEICKGNSSDFCLRLRAGTAPLP